MCPGVINWAISSATYSGAACEAQAEQLRLAEDPGDQSASPRLLPTGCCGMEGLAGQEAASA